MSLSLQILAPSMVTSLWLWWWNGSDNRKWYSGIFPSHQGSSWFNHKLKYLVYVIYYPRLWRQECKPDTSWGSVWLSLCTETHLKPQSPKLITLKSSQIILFCLPKELRNINREKNYNSLKPSKSLLSPLPAYDRCSRTSYLSNCLWTPFDAYSSGPVSLHPMFPGSSKHFVTWFLKTKFFFRE